MIFKPTIILGRPVDQRCLPIQTIFRSLNFWIIVGYSVLFLLAYQYCSHTYRRDPTSFFFNPSGGYRKIYSLQREKHAAAFIEAKNRSSDVLSSHRAPSICLGLATVARAGEQYVRSTVGSMLEGLSADQRNDIQLVIFFAQTDPQNHPIYHERWLKNVADQVVEYNVSENQMALLISLKDQHQF